MSDDSAALPFDPTDTFVHRHIGPSPDDVSEMLKSIGCASLDDLLDQTVPSDIRWRQPLGIGPPRGEYETIRDLRALAEKNEVRRSLIGMGYYACITPPVIQRNILENPGWYTQYTPYQAEISQGRLEALLNFQTMVADLTALPVANASLLDEATAAAEAMQMCRAAADDDARKGFYVADDCHPQTIALVRSRAEPLGISVTVGPATEIDAARQWLFGILLQYPATDGSIIDYTETIRRAREGGARAVVATDLLALTLIKPPGEFGADIAVGSAQRFGVPMGYGGPHAAFISCRDDLKRQLPGRLVGVSKDAAGRVAYRLAIQTREQHIRREKATSNICTAQVLLAIMAGMYAVYHGPSSVRRIAHRVAALTASLAEGLRRLRHEVTDQEFFDTVSVRVAGGANARQGVLQHVAAAGINLREYPDGRLGISLDERSTPDEVAAILNAFNDNRPAPFTVEERAAGSAIPESLSRKSSYLTHPVFNSYHSETEMLRYLKRLESRDLSLAQSMIPLGSCTMKLNGTSEMLPITWPQFADMHPFAPPEQARGYAALFKRLEKQLSAITGFPAVSLQPNAGSQGEYAGLMAIRAYHARRGEGARNICLIPTSAHGTNPASAVSAGMRVVAVNCDDRGDIDLADLKAKAEQHAASLAALMVTYPSTHGVFESTIREVCKIVHASGGQVYLDGANMNALVGVCRPADIGADVCHINLHKTFCIPHGGGGPGVGPIAVAGHLAPFLPDHPIRRVDGAGEHAIGPISAAPYGSASILPISWAYIALMGDSGLVRATQVAILNANYMAKRLEGHYGVLYRGAGGRIAHEFILDVRPFDKSAGVRVDDVAKRLMDYGFHAPTMSWPVAGTLMIEPTESESKGELDRFCDAMIAIREEIRAIERGEADREDNVLKGAPHCAEDIASDSWSHSYGRRAAAYALPWVRQRKAWPAVGRIDNVWGDRHLFCMCPTVVDNEGAG